LTASTDRGDPAAPAFEESVEDLYENAPCGYLSSLPGGLIVKVNQTFLNWTGYRREDVIGRRRFQDLLTPGGKIYHETHYAPLLRMQGEVQEIAFEVGCAGGGRLPVLVNSVFRTDESGTPILIRTTIFNASGRKEYERELVRERERAERADKAKADFISMISHEIRTPLNAIMGVAHLLGATELSPQQEKFVRILRSSSENLLHLVNEVLDFSKIESGKVTLEERAVDLRKLIHEVVAAFYGKAEEKGLVLEARVDDRLPCILLGDPVKIGQVLANLLGNAIKFTAKGSVILELRVLEVEEEAVAVEIRVADTGIGIAPDRLQHIFEDYTQASYDIGMKYGGTGLGLSISKRLVEMHGSRLHVESELGHGTAFSFQLRMKKGPPGVEEIGPHETAEPQSLRGLRVLIADDNEVNVFVLTGLLRRWCVEYDVVTDGRQAVESVQGRDYDLVLMDLRMPELDGYAATRRIRSLPDPKFARLPIFALSASTRMGHQHELDAAGFTEFVGKPINPDVLFKKLAQYSR
jgi:PAS domain S-box-containing protein